MVRPVKPLSLVNANGEVEILDPRRERLSVQHPEVRRRPEHFVPVDRKDSATAREMKRMLRRAEHDELREIERLRHGGPATGLPAAVGRAELDCRLPARSRATGGCDDDDPRTGRHPE